MQIDIEILEHLNSQAVAIAEDAEHKMLRSYVVILEPSRFFAAVCHDVPDPL